MRGGRQWGASGSRSVVVGGVCLAHVGEPWGCVKGMACSQSGNGGVQQLWGTKKGARVTRRVGGCHPRVRICR